MSAVCKSAAALVGADVAEKSVLNSLTSCRRAVGQAIAAASGAAAAGAETLLLLAPEFRRADQPRLEQALKRGGLWMAKQQATRHRS